MPCSEPAIRDEKRPSLGSDPGGAHRWRSTGWPVVPASVPTSTSVCPRTQAFGTVKLKANGTCCRFAGTPGPVTCSSLPKTWRFDAAATEIAAGALLGEPTEPKPKSSRSLPAEITGTTPAAATLSRASIRASAEGSTSGPPPEKLITSMPSFTAASKASTISGVKASRPPVGTGTLKTR
jgi:hypothetical protein